MTKVIHSILLIAYLVSLSIALPSAPRQPPQSNEPRTLLGKPYRRLWKSSQPNPLSRWTPVLPSIDSDHSSTTGTITAATTSPDHSQIEASKEDAHTYAHTFHQVSLPPSRQVPIMNASPSRESRGFGISLDLAGFGTERLRLGLGLGRSKGPLRYMPSAEEVLRFDQNIVVPGASGRCHLLSPPSEQPPVAAIEPGVESQKPLLPRKPSKRLYDRGEWKSRLSEDY